MKILLTCQALLLSCVLLTLLILWWPVCWCDEKHCLEVLLISGLLCVAPGLIALVIPLVVVESRLVGLAVLLGGVLRMLMVLAGLLIVMATRPSVPPMLFGGCLVAIYIVCLAVETVVVLRLLAKKSCGGDSVPGSSIAA